MYLKWVKRQRQVISFKILLFYFPTDPCQMAMAGFCSDCHKAGTAGGRVIAIFISIMPLLTH